MSLLKLQLFLLLHIIFVVVVNGSVGFPDGVDGGERLGAPLGFFVGLSDDDHTRTGTIDSTVNYLDVPWVVLNEWLSQLNGNMRDHNNPLLVERGITRQKVLDELERRFRNEEEADTEEEDDRSLSDYSVEEVDHLAKTNPRKFLDLKDREMAQFKYHGRYKYKKESEYRMKRKKEDSLEKDDKAEGNEHQNDEKRIRLAFERVQVLGYGRDWKAFRNPHGYSHFEELLIYQPRGWKTFAREYLFKYGGNINSSIEDAGEVSSPTARLPPGSRACFNCGSRKHLVSACDKPIDKAAVKVRKAAFFKKKNVSIFDFHNTFTHEDLKSRRTVKMKVDGYSHHVDITMKDPISVVLFHPEISRHNRYKPLNFLLAYGCKNPFPEILADLKQTAKDDAVCQLFLAEISPLDYFFDFQRSVKSYKLDMLRRIGAKSQFPRLPYIKELDFCDIVGQRMAKEIVRSEVVRFIWDRITESKQTPGKQPLSLIFAGPSGVGKTELASNLAKLMNRPGPEGNPGSDHFLKVDCGKMTDAWELFGLSGAYQGATQGSALNNFILRKSRERGSLGIVLLDEIEKAGQGVIHALYQVLDKG